MLISFIKLARPGQWIKNIFVLAGVIFAGRYSDNNLLLTCISAAIIFCIASSSVYALNDCMDAEEDKNNPVKKSRPVASGKLTRLSGLLFSAALAVISVFFAFYLNIKMGLITFIYIFLNVAYSRFLKTIVIVDVFCISLGFMLRVFAGTYAVDIPPSSWIIICTMMLSLFLGWCKRYSELVSSPDSMRIVLKKYSKSYLEILLGISASCTILSYGLYTISPRTIEQHGTENLIFTLPIVIFGLFRYLYLVMLKNRGKDTASEIFKDLQILITVVVYVAAIYLIKI